MNLQQRRETCREALQRAYVEVADPERALWPSDNLTGPTQQRDVVEQLNGALYQFVMALRQRSELEPGRWTDDVVGGHEFPDGATLPVKLAHLDKWRGVSYTDESTAGVQTVYLPVAYVRELLRQATAIAETHGFLDARGTPEDWRKHA